MATVYGGGWKIGRGVGDGVGGGVGEAVGAGTGLGVAAGGALRVAVAGMPRGVGVSGGSPEALEQAARRRARAFRLVYVRGSASTSIPQSPLMPNRASFDRLRMIGCEACVQRD
jgi:hypothetical protein